VQGTAGIGILAYPNPAEENVTVVVEVNTNQAALVQVTSSLGSIVAEAPCQRVDALRFPVASWPAGTYWVRVTDASGTTLARTMFSVTR
jgi:hypothetical protein